jgi:enoyl-CoA hydratase
MDVDLTEAIRYERDPEKMVAWITMNRPERLNALTMACYRRIADLIHEAEQDDDIRVIAFKGEGRAFTSGQDVEEAYFFYYRDGEDRGRRPSMRRRLLANDRNLWGKGGMTESIFYCLKPTVSMIHGRCFGAGIDILLACDMAICSDDATFGHPGFTYHGFGGDLASYLVHMGPKHAKEFTLTSRPFDAAKAERLGIVNSVVPLDRLRQETDELIADIVKMPFDALVMQKAHYRVVLDGMGFATNFSAAHQAIAFASNIRYEPGENAMVKDREAMGFKEAIKARKEYYGHL